MTPVTQHVARTARWIEQNSTLRPRIGFLTGTGLGAGTRHIDIEKNLPYGEIPHFPTSTVQGHEGQLLLGTLSGSPVMAMQGRFHLYEGYTPAEVTFPIRVMQALGVTHLIISNASGGLNPAFDAGDIMLISDHINLTGHNPLRGPNPPEWGIRFPDMTGAYNAELRQTARTLAESAGIRVQEGVYAGLMGPSLETPAEMRYLRTIGADAVGFSTVMETIAGVHAGMQVLGLSTITNINNPDAPQPATLEAIIDTAEKAAGHVGDLLAGVVSRL